MPWRGGSYIGGLVSRKHLNITQGVVSYLGELIRVATIASKYTKGFVLAADQIEGFWFSVITVCRVARLFAEF
jgi:hypothetical protein